VKRVRHISVLVAEGDLLFAGFTTPAARTDVRTIS